MENKVRILSIIVGILCISFGYHLYIDNKNMNTIEYNLVHLHEMMDKQVKLDSIVSVKFEEVVRASNTHHDALDTLLRTKNKGKRDIEWFERPLNYDPNKMR